MTDETQAAMSPSQPGTDRIETRRLILRPAVYFDAPGLHRLLADSHVCRYSPHPPVASLADTHFVIVEWREARSRGIRTYVGASRSDPKNPIGFIQVGPDEELGGLLSPERSGEGLGTEALQAVMTILDLRHAWTIIDAEHHALIHTLEKASIRQERLLPSYRVHPQISTRARDCVLLRQQRDA